MYKTLQFIISFAFFTFIISPNSTFIFSQTTVVTDIKRPAAVFDSAQATKKKISGATVRGRIVYEDSGLPVRYVEIGLKKVKGRQSSFYTVFTKTDDNGEFVLFDTAEGVYYPHLRNDGILNSEAYDILSDFDKNAAKTDQVFQKVNVPKAGEVEVLIQAKRGNSISGVIKYFDGEVAAGVKVEILKKIGERFLIYPLEEAMTDDRGYYRFAGLPDGNYTVRVIEPVSHKKESSSFYSSTYKGNGLYKTYFSKSKTAKEANNFVLANGQEKTGIDINLPERKFFNVSGKIVLKKNGKIIDGFKVTLQKMASNIDDGSIFHSTLNYSETFDNDSVSTSDSDTPGEWSVKNISKGKYKVIAKQETSYSKKDKNRPVYSNISKEIEIVDGDISNVILEIPEAASINGIVAILEGKVLPNNGRVYLQNLETKKLTYTGFDYKLINSKKVVKEKPFALNKLNAGKYKIKFSTKGINVQSVLVKGMKLKDGIIELKDGEKIKDIKINVVSEIGTITGKVSNLTFDEPTFVVLIKVGAKTESINEENFVGRISKDGSYKIKASEGEYNLIILKQSELPKGEKAVKEFLENDLTNTEKVTLIKDKTITLDLE